MKMQEKMLQVKPKPGTLSLSASCWVVHFVNAINYTPPKPNRQRLWSLYNMESTGWKPPSIPLSLLNGRCGAFGIAQFCSAQHPLPLVVTTRQMCHAHSASTNELCHEGEGNLPLCDHCHLWNDPTILLHKH